MMPNINKIIFLLKFQSFEAKIILGPHRKTMPLKIRYSDNGLKELHAVTQNCTHREKDITICSLPKVQS